MQPRDPVKVVFVAGAPSRFSWQATFGDWEFEDPLGVGASEEEAIEDLIWAAGENA